MLLPIVGCNSWMPTVGSLLYLGPFIPQDMLVVKVGSVIR